MEINYPLQGAPDVLSHQVQCAPFSFISPNSRALNLLVQTLLKYCQFANPNCWFDERRHSFISGEADQ